MPLESGRNRRLRGETRLKQISEMVQQIQRVQLLSRKDHDSCGEVSQQSGRQQTFFRNRVRPVRDTAAQSGRGEGGDAEYFEFEAVERRAVGCQGFLQIRSGN